MIKMKVVFLHPPPYPVNIDFFNYLGQFVDLVVFIFGEHPINYPNWHIEKLKKNITNFKIKIFGHGPVTFRTKIDSIFVNKLMKENPDIVVSISFWPFSFYAGILKKFLNFKLIILSNANQFTENNKGKGIFLYRTVLSHLTDAYIAATPETVRYLRNLFSDKPVFLSLQTINVESWIKAINELPDKNNIRKALYIPKEKIVLLQKFLINFTTKTHRFAIIYFI